MQWSLSEGGVREHRTLPLRQLGRADGPRRWLGRCPWTGREDREWVEELALHGSQMLSERQNDVAQKIWVGSADRRDLDRDTRAAA